MHGQPHFLPLFLIMGLAFLVPVGVARVRFLRVPAVVAEIICGVAVGQSGLRVVAADPILDFLSLFGFVYLMFLSGLEIDFTQIFGGRSGRPVAFRARPLFVAVLLFLGTILCASLTAWFMVHMGLVPREALVLMVILFSTVSVGVVMPTLKERKLSGSPLGQLVLVTAVLADIVTLLVFGGVAAVSRGAAWPELLLVLLLVPFVWTAVGLGKYASRRGVLAKLFEGLTGASTQIRVRGSLALLLVFVALTEYMGLEAVVGAFLAGAVVSLNTPREHTLLTHKLEALGYGFFVPIFFIMVGVKFDVSVLAGGWNTFFLLGTLVGGRFLVKIVPAMALLGGRFGIRKALAAGVILSPMLSLGIAISVIGMELGLISEELNSAIIMLAIVTAIVAPAGFARLIPAPWRQASRIVIGGAGRVGRQLAERLVAQHETVILIDKDADQLLKAPREAAKVHGDITDENLMKGLAIRPTDSFVALTGRDDINLRACRLVQSLCPGIRVIGRDNNPENTTRFASKAILPVDPTGCLALSIENLILRPGLAELLIHESPDREVFEVHVGRLAPDRRKVQDFADFPETLFLCVRRDDDVIVPRGDTRLEVGDVIVALGPEQDKESLRRILGSAEYRPAPSGSSSDDA